MWLRLLCWTQFLLICVVKSSDLNYLRLLDDLISYRISFKSSDEELKYKTDDSKNWISMMSADDEEYRCLLPTVETIVNIFNISFF